MDTKWKNNRKIRRICGVIIILALAIVNLALIPAINKSAENLKNEDSQRVNTYMFSEMVYGLYGGSYVLYLENLERMSGGGTYDASVFAENLSKKEEDYDTDAEMEYGSYSEVLGTMNDILQEAVDDFSLNRQEIDYAVFSKNDKVLDLQESNTTERLAEYVVSDNKKEVLSSLEETYGIIMVISYDNNGVATVSDVYTAKDDKDLLLKMMQSETKDTFFAVYDNNLKKYHIEGPKNMEVVFGIPYSSMWGDCAYNNNYDVESYYGLAGGYTLSYVTLLVAFVVALLFVWLRRKEEKNGVAIRTKYRTLEIAVVTMAGIIYGGWDLATDIMWQAEHVGVEQLLNLGIYEHACHEIVCGLYLLALFGIYYVWYLCSMMVTEIGVFGVREWIRRRSLLYVLIIWIVRKWKQLKEELEQIELSEDVLRKLRKVFWVHFLVLAVISCFWFFGIVLLVIYSVACYLFVRKQIKCIQTDYQVLCEELEQLSLGKLDVEIPNSLGYFDSANEQIKSVKKGFSQAVEDEVRSQKMKTELVTNVSHDLKTPLTAIMTYIGLLQQENITPEQEKEYLQVLEQKSKRLKVLIEDLFEVSKANSDNLELQLQEVEVVSLIKQVVTEHQESLDEKQLQIRYKVPDEKKFLMLDSEKAYRIYENLLVNVQKYALEGTRVFIKVYETSDGIVTAISNISKDELAFDEETITERFVRGDKARNTEGSGLGLAIAKSFAQAMNGDLQISIDGDLFQASISWDK